MTRLVFLALALAFAAGCASAPETKDGDTYPRHERWWK